MYIRPTLLQKNFIKFASQPSVAGVVLEGILFKAFKHSSSLIINHSQKARSSQVKVFSSELRGKGKMSSLPTFEV